MGAGLLFLVGLVAIVVFVLFITNFRQILNFLLTPVYLLDKLIDYLYERFKKG